jgi:beta-mannan synthase
MAAAFFLLAIVHQIWCLLFRLAVRIMVPLTVVISLKHAKEVLTYLKCKAAQHYQKRRPEDRYVRKPLPSRDAAAAWPKVAVQLPMFNERAVCQQLIDYSCAMEWPTSRFRVQVLDDSTDVKTRQFVDDKVAEWREKGVDIECLRRTNRHGYKAGAMKQGLESLQEYKYVAVFDADFRPEADFLLRTVPYLEGNADVAYVQARWTFSNAEESYLTKIQELSLSYHFKCEQYTHFADGCFFNFNGTAGVWRNEAISSVGGWYSRTTVEDMDLSLRTYLAGWKAVFLEDVGCISEVPSSLYAYRKQQHRWTTGPVQLLIKVLPDLWRSKIALKYKIDLLLWFFGVGKFATHTTCFVFYCFVVPLSVFTPQIPVPIWSLLHMPVVVTLATCAFTRGGWTFAVTYVLFQNALAVVKIWAVVAGVLGLRHANEWVVTTKMGSGKGETMKVSSTRIYPAELMMSAFVALSALYGMYHRHHYGVVCYLFLQGLAFLAFGLNWVDASNILGNPLTSKDRQLLKKVIQVQAFANNHINATKQSFEHKT